MTMILRRMCVQYTGEHMECTAIHAIFIKIKQYKNGIQTWSVWFCDNLNILLTESYYWKVTIRKVILATNSDFSIKFMKSKIVLTV